MKLILLLALLQVPVISKFLTYREVTQSVHAASMTSANAPDSRQLFLIQVFGKEYFDPLRVRVGSPLYVSSLFRSKEVNRAVGGAKNSEHQITDDVVAVDIDQDGRGKVVNRALFFIIKDETNFRKLIWEFGTPMSPSWVHVSWSPDQTKNIKKVYRATRIGNRVTYTHFDQIP